MLNPYRKQTVGNSSLLLEKNLTSSPPYLGLVCHCWAKLKFVATAMTGGQQNFATFFMLASLALRASNTNSLFLVVLAKKPKKKSLNFCNIDAFLWLSLKVYVCVFCDHCLFLIGCQVSCCHKSFCSKLPDYFDNTKYFAPPSAPPYFLCISHHSCRRDQDQLRKTLLIFYCCV